MTTNDNCPDDQNAVPVVLERRKTECEDNVSKTYRVTLSVNMVIGVDVQADSKAMAEGIVHGWDSISIRGHDRVSPFFWFDDEGKEYREDDGGDLFWDDIADADNHEILSIAEVDAEDGDETPEELAI